MLSMTSASCALRPSTWMPSAPTRPAMRVSPAMTAATPRSCAIGTIAFGEGLERRRRPCRRRAGGSRRRRRPKARPSAGGRNRQAGSPGGAISTMRQRFGVCVAFIAVCSGPVLLWGPILVGLRHSRMPQCLNRRQTSRPPRTSFRGQNLLCRSGTGSPLHDRALRRSAGSTRPPSRPSSWSACRRAGLAAPWASSACR